MPLSDRYFEPVNRLKGMIFPSVPLLAGKTEHSPSGTTQLEKRGIAVNVPEWIPENCIQCNQCAYVCPHAAIRPFLLNEDRKEKCSGRNGDTESCGQRTCRTGIQDPGQRLDCTGCGNCVDVCPAKTKALEFKTLGSQMPETTNWDYLINNVTYKTNVARPFQDL